VLAIGVCLLGLVVGAGLAGASDDSGSNSADTPPSPIPDVAKYCGSNEGYLGVDQFFSITRSKTPEEAVAGLLRGLDISKDVTADEVADNMSVLAPTQSPTGEADGLIEVVVSADVAEGVLRTYGPFHIFMEKSDDGYTPERMLQCQVPTA